MAEIHDSEIPATADLLDEHPELQVLDPGLRNFGGRARFAGPIRTCTAPEDNGRVREILSEPGDGAVLVIDGGGGLRCALLGDRLGQLGVTNGWAGIVVNGCVRDTAVLATLPLGVRALAAHPRKSEKRGLGTRDHEVVIAGARVRPGDTLVADEDGLVLLPSTFPFKRAATTDR